MQSFKQYLREDDRGDTCYFVSCWSTFDVGYDKSSIINEIEKINIFPGAKLQTEFAKTNDEVIVTIVRIKNADCTVSNFGKLASELRQIFENHNLADLNYTDSFLCLEKLPKTVVNAGTVMLDTAGQGLSITGIDKVVKCWKLVVSSSKIKGGVLSLLKMTDEDGNKTAFNFKGSAPWIPIFNKHIKDRDILSCQEELIEAGLKEYAKL